MMNFLSIENQSATEPIIKVYQPGIYSVSVTTDCEILKDSVTVQVEASDLFIPNVITPNGDGINDNFEIKTGTNELALKVLNR